MMSFSRQLVRARRRVLVVVAVLAALPLPEHPLRLIPAMKSLILRVHISLLLMRPLRHLRRLGLLRKMKMMMRMMPRATRRSFSDVSIAFSLFGVLMPKGEKSSI
jgi:hypothetical protein